jgi:hypothetical protein
MTISAEQRTSRQRSRSARPAPVGRSRVSDGLPGTGRAVRDMALLLASAWAPGSIPDDRP